MFNKSNFCHIASNNRNEQKGSVFIYKTTDTLAQVTQSGYFNEKLIDINVHDLIIHVQYNSVNRTLKKSVLIVTERTLDNVATQPITDETILNDIGDLGEQVAEIEGKIPSDASSTNQLATQNDITDKITNCITEIPQDIKLEINSENKLVVKAGTTYYVPNGVGVFEKRTITTDLVWNYTGSATGQRMIIINSTGNVDCPAVTSVFSGSTMPTPNGVYWYNTDENIVYAKTSETNIRPGISLSLGVISIENGAVKSIDQVFNGFGYIGSTVFALPNVKGLIPDGRNADGTLKNRNLTVQSVLTRTIPSNTGWHYITINSEGTNFDFATNYYTGTELPSGATTYSRFYNTAENLTYVIVSGKLTRTPQLVLGYYIDHSTSSPYKINSMKQAAAFRAVDYNDTEFIAHQAMPSDRYVDLTLPADGGYVTAPADGYLYLSKTTTASGQRVGLLDSSVGPGAFSYSTSTGQSLIVYLSVRKSENIQIRYSADGTTNSFRFIYANGVK